MSDSGGKPGVEDGRTAGSTIRRMVAAARRRVERGLRTGGPAFRRLVLTNSASTAGDALVAIALAGTLFFSVPSAEARTNVALYLLLTLAPFVVLAPLLGMLLGRYPTAYRHGLVTAAVSRAVAAVMLAARIESLWLYPLAFLLLVLSRLHTVSRSTLLPAALAGPTSLVAANARLARIGVLAGALVAPVGIVGLRIAGSWLTLLLAAACFVLAAMQASELPAPPDPGEDRRRRDATPAVDPASHPSLRASLEDLVRTQRLPHGVRLAQLATAGVRLLNGFLLLLLAFALHRTGSGLLDFGTLIAAGGAGFFIAAVVSPWFEQQLREEPMVVVALALEAGAAFVTAQAFGVPLAATLAAAAGLAWGMAKFAFDGLLQAATPQEGRGIAFTRSETLFASAWVLGALVPVAVRVPTALGLTAAGLVALAAQVIYVSGLLLPQRPEGPEARPGGGGDL